jgi:hypothetical protein
MILYVGLIKPWFNHWGATDAEVNMALPGDKIVAQPYGGYTRAITIHAPVEQVWPWIVQIGYKRAGWYSYDWIDKILGCADFVDGDHSSVRIVPELQDLQVGDQIYLHPQIAESVVIVEPGQTLLLQAGDPASMQADPENFSYATWLFYLQSVDATTTRLIVRSRADYAGAMNWLINTLVEPGNFIMEQKMMRGIRSRAEAAYNGHSQ